MNAKKFMRDCYIEYCDVCQKETGWSIVYDKCTGCLTDELKEHLDEIERISLEVEHGIDLMQEREHDDHD